MLSIGSLSSNAIRRMSKLGRTVASMCAPNTAWRARSGMLMLGAALPAVAHAQNGTTTGLTVNPSAGLYGSSFRMTAQVTVSGLSVHTLRGNVTFTDTVGGTTHVLGTVQLQSAAGTAGQAVLQQALGTIGNHSIKATFNPTSYFTSSTSSVQNVKVTGFYPTTTSLVTTGGTAGSYSLNATVIGIGSPTLDPTNTVALNDASNGNYLLGTATLGTGTITRRMIQGPNSPVGAGVAPWRVVAADFTGEGFTDLAVLNLNDGTISILIGNGAGQFSAGTTITGIGTGALGLATADLNGDGKLDLVVGNGSNQKIAVLLGNGDGTFKSQLLPPVTPGGSAATAIALGDFNGDGIVDIAVSNTVSAAVHTGQVFIYLGDGLGGFALSSITPTTIGTNPETMVAGDFNRDGNLDLATANVDDGTISVLLGDGTGRNFVNSNTALPLVTVNGASAIPQAYGIATADFDGDGKLDLAVTEFNAAQVAVLKGNGNGTFGTAAIFSTPANAGPAGIVAGDFNGDGIVDLATANFTASSTTYFLGTGTGTFQTPAPTIVTGGQNAVSLATADLDGDGNGDLAIANANTNNVSILLDQVVDTASATFNMVSVPGSGTHQVNAVYQSDSSFNASTSNTVPLTASPISTTTLLSASSNSVVFGQQVTFTVSITPTQVGNIGLTNADTVTFRDNGTVIAISSFNNGFATYNYVGPTVGTHTITATFNGDANFLSSTAQQVITIFAANTQATIQWNTPAPIPYGTVLSSQQLNATATIGNVSVPGTYTYTPAAGTVLPLGTQTLTVVFTPSNLPGGTSSTKSVQIQVVQATPTLQWPKPDPITYGTPLDSVQLNASAISTAMVPLDKYYNVYAEYTDGTKFNTGGFDGGGNAYSASALGSNIVWNGVTYGLGPINAPDAISNVATPIAVPAGNYTAITVIGAMVNNVSPKFTYVVNYTDGTSASTLVSMSDWVYPQSLAGETTIECHLSRNTYNGTIDSHSTCIYGYQIPTDSNKVVQSVLIPQDRNAVILAMGAVGVPIPGTFVYTPAAGTVLQSGSQTLTTVFTPNNSTNYKTVTATVPITVNPATTTLNWAQPAPIMYGTPLSGTQLNAVPNVNTGMVIPPVSASYRVSSIFSDGQSFSVNGFGGTSEAYSADLIGTSVVWSGTTFPLGPSDLPNALSSSTLPMPPEKFYSLYFLAAANGNQPNQTFTINYTDGTSVSSQVSISNWTAPQNYTGESIAQVMPYLNTSTGGRANGNSYVYGYQLPLNPAKTLQSVTLPNNQNVVVLSLALSTQASPSITVPGTTTYNPPAGTILPIGTNPLNASFAPTDTQNYTKATATTSIVVTQVTGESLTLSSNNNPALPGSSVTLTAALPPTPNGATAPTGSISFFDNGVSLGSAVAVTNGSASLTVPNFANGTHPITAVYSGDPNYGKVTSQTLNQVVGKGSATVVPKGVPNPSLYTQSVIITITVTGQNNVAPTGFVNLTYLGNPLGGNLTLSPGSNGTSTATYTTSVLPAGSDNIIATYSGDNNYN